MDTVSFCSRIEAILKTKKIPKMQFYKDCEITASAFSAWKNKKAVPTTKNIERLAKYLGVTRGYLLGDPMQDVLAPNVTVIPADNGAANYEALGRATYELFQQQVNGTLDNKKSPTNNGEALSPARLEMLNVLDGLTDEQIRQLKDIVATARKMYD